MTIRLATNVTIQVCSVISIILLIVFGNLNNIVSKTVLAAVAIIQAATSYLAHRSTPAGVSIRDKSLKKMT